MSVVRAAPAPLVGAEYLELLREAGDLKRIRSAGRAGSIATRLFVAAWSALVGGADVASVMVRTVASGLAAARLGDLDLPKLRELGMTHDAAAAVLERGFDAVAGPLDPALAARLRRALAAPSRLPGEDAVPRFVRLLADQPRAGVTCPGRPRLMLEPAENHAEHSLVVALYGVIVAPAFGADAAEVFLAGLAHHLHSAAMPDSGFTGEVLLGDDLDAVIGASRALAMAELPPALAGLVEHVTGQLASDTTPAARAFHAADVIDRVLEIEQHLKAARTGMDDVLDAYGLVHDGPVKAFHDRVLAGIGLP